MFGESVSVSVSVSASWNANIIKQRSDYAVVSCRLDRNFASGIPRKTGFVAINKLLRTYA